MIQAEMHVGDYREGMKHLISLGGLVHFHINPELPTWLVWTLEMLTRAPAIAFPSTSTTLTRIGTSVQTGDGVVSTGVSISAGTQEAVHSESPYLWV